MARSPRALQSWVVCSESDRIHRPAILRRKDAQAECCAPAVSRFALWFERSGPNQFRREQLDREKSKSQTLPGIAPQPFRVTTRLVRMGSTTRTIARPLPGGLLRTVRAL